ncbi:lipoprotein [Klebsiella variicola]|nr:lipoprotein [Klebsiella variicola]
MSRMYDGKEEVIAAEYMPMVLQLVWRRSMTACR